MGALGINEIRSSSIHSVIPLACANAAIPCRSQELLPFFPIIYFSIFFHSLLCPNKRNLCNLIVSVIVVFLITV
jgi:hypothetical protein